MPAAETTFDDRLRALGFNPTLTRDLSRHYKSQLIQGMRAELQKHKAVGISVTESTVVIAEGVMHLAGGGASVILLNTKPHERETIAEALKQQFAHMVDTGLSEVKDFRGEAT